MIVLTIRTEKPEAEIGIFDGDKEMGYLKWQAHRELSETIHKKLDKLLHDNQKNWVDIQGIVMYKGPGSFTGLRIGFSVGNALALASGVPIVASGGEDWIAEGISILENGDAKKVATPEYGSEPKTTKPRK